MTCSQGPTVATLQTPAGAGGIAVITLAGPDAREVLQRVFTPKASPASPADGECLRLGHLVREGERVDEAIVSVRCAGAGEWPLAEINIHGGPRVTQRALALLVEAGATVVPQAEGRETLPASWPLAAPGLNNPTVGREMLSVVPTALTRFALETVTAQWSGGVSRLAADTLETLQHGGEADAKALHAAADRVLVMQLLLNPAEVVLAGPPNAGKSSLANALLGRPACIVTDVAGTTRDWVRELADIDGRPVWLTDTAGLWEADDHLDRQAVDRAWGRVDEADLVLAVFDSANPPSESDEHWRRLLSEADVLLIANKSDLADAPPTAIPARSESTGLAELRSAVVSRLGLADIDPATPAAFTERQTNHLRAAADAKSPDAAIKELMAFLGRLVVSDAP